MPRTENETKQSQFRLRPDTLADLDRIAELLSVRSGVPHSRTDAVRYAARQIVLVEGGQGRKKSGKKQKSC